MSAGVPPERGAMNAALNAALADVDSVRIAFDSSALTTLKIVIAAILFGIALDTRLSDFRAAVRHPWPIAVAIVGQFLLLPAITFALTLALDVRGSVALGMILVACCPPGNVSNILTHRAGGDVALSVAMTSISTKASLGRRATAKQERAGL